MTKQAMKKVTWIKHLVSQNNNAFLTITVSIEIQALERNIIFALDQTENLKLWWNATPLFDS